MHLLVLLDFGLLLACDSELLPGEIMEVRTCKHDCFVLVYCSVQSCCALAAATLSL
jgi:hypothetical protein